MGYQTSARTVRQAQKQAGPEYIRPDTASSKQAVTPAASKSTYDVRWSKPDMGSEACFYKGLHIGRSGTARSLLALAEQDSLTTGFLISDSALPCPLILTLAPSTRS